MSSTAPIKPEEIPILPLGEAAQLIELKSDIATCAVSTAKAPGVLS